MTLAVVAGIIAPIIGAVAYLAGRHHIARMYRHYARR